MSSEQQKIPVNAEALFQVLKALNGPPHYIRELQATRSLPLVNNPINVLFEDYKAWSIEPNKTKGLA